MEEIMKLDLYDILGITSDSDKQSIRSAYRREALKCHPDKNPDDPNAAKLFLQLTKALEVLLDDKARDAYDQILKNKEAVRARNENLDSERKRFKYDLDQREREAEKQSYNEQSAQERLQKEIERLRKQGSKDVEEERARIRRELARQRNEFQCAQKRVHVSWKSDESGGYNEENLNKIFSKYGDIDGLVISNKKGTAILEFSSSESAKRAAMIELGYPSKPLITKLLGETNTFSRMHSTNANKISPSLSPIVPEVSNSSNQSSADWDAFEDYVLRTMKEVQAKKNAEKVVVSRNN